jgi:hypothetical protein
MPFPKSISEDLCLHENDKAVGNGNVIQECYPAYILVIPAALASRVPSH